MLVLTGIIHSLMARLNASYRTWWKTAVSHFTTLKTSYLDSLDTSSKKLFKVSIQASPVFKVQDVGKRHNNKNKDESKMKS
jgi:hypothetical protein